MRRANLFLFSYLEAALNFFPDLFLGNRLRRYFYLFFFKDVGKGLIVNVGCHFEVPENITIGNNCSFNRGCWISGGGHLQIGNDVILGPNVIIHTANHNYSDFNVRIRSQGHNFKRVLIKDNVWIGAGAIILPGVTIGPNAIVAAGAVVTKDVLVNSIVGGSPARFIKKLYEECQNSLYNK